MTVYAAGGSTVNGVVHVYDTTTLLNSSVQVAGGSGPAQPDWFNIAAIQLSNLQVGQLLLMTVDLEVSKPTTWSYYADVVTQVVAGTSLGSSLELALEAAGQDIQVETSGSMTHLMINRTGVFKVTDPTHNWLTLQLNSASTAAGASDFLTVQNYLTSLLSVVQLPATTPFN